MRVVRVEAVEVTVIVEHNRLPYAFFESAACCDEVRALLPRFSCVGAYEHGNVRVFIIIYRIYRVNKSSCGHFSDLCGKLVNVSHLSCPEGRLDSFNRTEDHLPALSAVSAFKQSSKRRSYAVRSACVAKRGCGNKLSVVFRVGLMLKLDY